MAYDDRGLVLAQAVRKLAYQNLRRYSSNPADTARNLLPEDNVTRAALVCKAIVEGSTSDAFGEYAQAAREFAGAVRERSILGRLIGSRRVPTNTRMVGSIAGCVAYFVGEAAPIPITAPAFTSSLLAPKKVAALIVISNELARSMDPSADGWLKAELQTAVVDRLNASLIDPNNAGSADEPASILHASTDAPVSTFETTGDPYADIRALIAAFDGDLEQAFFVMHPETAAALALWADADGNDAVAFQNIGVRGGELLGIPVICSRAVPKSDTDGSIVALIDASAISWAEGITQIVPSTNADVLMTTAPDTGAARVSMFQTESTAIKIVQEINWKAARAGAAAYVSGVNYGAQS